jgi:integrase
MLTDLHCKSLISQSIRLGRPIKKSDGNGLFLYAKPKGKAYWRYKYHYLGKENLMSFGPYPYISLGEARALHEQAYREVAKGNNPVKARQAEQRQAIQESRNTFEAVGRAWHTHNLAKWSPSHAKAILRCLTKDLFASIGHIPVHQLTRRQLLEALQKIEQRPAPEMARRSLQLAGCILNHALNEEYCQSNVASRLEGSLKPFKKGHYPSMALDDLPVFLRKLNSDVAIGETAKDAIRLLMLTLVRRNELLQARWAEFDFSKAIWTIPAQRMKMRKEHVVPLSSQAIKLLVKRRRANDVLHGMKQSPFVFPSFSSADKPINNKCVGLALNQLGYKDKHTAHGFRALGMGIAKEKLGYRHEVPDRQLAHVPANEVDRAYDRAKFLPERTRMMQELADYLEKIS